VEAGAALIGLALVVFGVVRPLVRQPVVEPQRFVEEPEIVELSPVDYTLKLAETRQLVGEDVGRASAVVRQMLAGDAV